MKNEIVAEVEAFRKWRGLPSVRRWSGVSEYYDVLSATDGSARTTRVPTDRLLTSSITMGILVVRGHYFDGTMRLHHKPLR
jgi:hypothetical protein